MAKQLNAWLDEFVENGANPSEVENWPENSGGGSSSNASIVTLDEVKTLVPVGSYMDVAKIRAFLTAKNLDATEITGFDISILCWGDLEHIFDVTVWDNCDYSYSNLDEVLTNVQEEIENAVLQEGYYDNQFFRILYQGIRGEVVVEDSVILALNYTTYNSEEGTIEEHFMYLTPEDITSLLSVKTSNESENN